MAPFLDATLSLEDIIKKNHVGRKFGSMNAKRGRDARQNIITNKRTKIVDARDRLAELARRKDARMKLEQLRSKKKNRDQNLNRGNSAIGGMRSNRRQQQLDVIDLTRSPRPSLPLFQTSSRQFGIQTSRKNPRAPKPIIRVIENDVDDYFPQSRQLYSSDYDMEEDRRPLSRGRIASMNFKIVAHNDEAKRMQERQSSTTSILKKRLRSTSPPGFDPERLRIRESPPRLPPILKKRSMVADTIKPASNYRHNLRTESPSPPAEYRIIVSNLRNSVTGADITELFGDIGGLKESRLVRPGTAEVIYKTLEDATKAVELYHNRQLDGHPMNCLLVNPRPSGILTVGRLSSSKSTNSCTVAPDIAAFHKVLFNQY